MRGLAGAERLAIGPLDEFNFHLRHLAETKDRIISPRIAGDALPIKADALLQYPAGGLDRAAFDLIDHAVRIDGFADVDRDGQPLDADVLGALDLGDDSTIGAGVLVARETKAITDACLFVGLPVGALGDRFYDVSCPRIRQVPQPKGDRIVAAPGCTVWPLLQIE